MSMAAIEREEFKGPRAEGADGRGKATRLALVRPGQAAPPSDARSLPPPAAAEDANDESFEAKARSWRGLWRMFQIVRVLGGMSLFLFLNDYDIRASFNAR